MLDKQFRGSESLLVCEVVRNNGLAGAQRIASRRGQIGPNACRADDPLSQPTPARTRRRLSAEMYSRNFAVFRAQSFRRHSGGVIEHADEVGTLQRKNSEFGKELLLANALSQRAAS